MNGFELSERILAIDINVKVCYMSSAEINREAYLQEGLSRTGLRKLIQRCEKEDRGFDIFPIPGQAYGKIMFVWHSKREEGPERN